jgi:hypothetical protein
MPTAAVLQPMIGALENKSNEVSCDTVKSSPQWLDMMAKAR